MCTVISVKRVGGYDKLRDSAPIFRVPYFIRSSIPHYPSCYVYGGYLRHMANRHLAVYNQIDLLLE